MKKATAYTVRKKNLPKTKKLKARIHKYAEPVEGYAFTANGLELFVYKFAPGQWFVIDPLTGYALGGSGDTRKKAVQYGASETLCNKLAEYRNTSEYDELVREFDELKEGVA